MNNFRLSATTDVHNQLQHDLDNAQSKLTKHRKNESILQNILYGITAVMMISGMSSITSITAPPIGITFGIISGVASAINMINVSILKKSQTKCQKYSSIINIIQSAISEMNLLIGGALDDNNISQQELEIIIEHYEKYRDKIKEVQRCYSKKKIIERKI